MLGYSTAPPSPSGLGLGRHLTSVVHASCTAGCRTFLWGGAGEPMHDDDGLCWCRCDGDSWSDTNILGRPSCVPVAAHLTFGWVGLCLSVVGLFHAAFHFGRQVRFHREQASALTSPIEQCRRQLHITAILVAILSIIYFSLVVGDELRLSMYFLCVLQIPVFVGIPVLSTRMWIYTNDRRVLQKSPEVLRISRWLETRVGHYVTYSMMSVAPVGALVLTFANCPEEAVIVISAGVIVLSIIVSILFWIWRSLLHGIDEALQQQQHKQEELQKMGVSRRVNEKKVSASTQDRSSGDTMLLAARKKVKKIVIFAIAVLVKVAFVLLFSILSPYGVEAPLLLFISPMTLVPPIWNIVNVMIHRGRTKLSSSGFGSGFGSGFVSYGQSRVASFSPSHVWQSRSRQQQVVVIAEAAPSNATYPVVDGAE